MVYIKGWQKTSLIDYSPYTTTVLFTGGCGFRCSYCHNPELVLHHRAIPSVQQKEILAYLKDKKMWIDGVCITGGEPTINKNLPEFIEKIKKIGMKVKLDTNGTNPTMIDELIKNKLIDFIAMDIKSPLKRYSEIAGVEVPEKKLQKTINLIMNSKVDYEFRTTVVPGLIGKKDVFLIGKWLKGAKKYAIQNFKNSGKMLNPGLKDTKPYSKEELAGMKKIAEEYFDEVEVRE